MTIKRHGVGEAKGNGQKALPFAKATEADGWLYVSGQTPMRDGEVVGNGIVEQSRIAIESSRMPDIAQAISCALASGLMMPVISGASTASFRNISAIIRLRALAFSLQWWWIARSRSTALPFARHKNLYPKN